MSEQAQAPEPLRTGGAPPRKSGFLADPAVRAMVYVALALVVLFLAAIVGVLATGVTAPTGPRSVAERELMLAAAQSKGATGAGLVPYIQALITTGDLPAARVALAQARGSIAATQSAAMLDLEEARLLSAEEDYSKAVAAADRAMKGFQAQRDARAKRAENEAEAKSILLGEGYYNAVLVKAYALVELARYKEAVAAFDTYLLRSRTASDIYIDRGNAKAALGDKVGAEKDFREALKYVPYDEEAKAGLKKIGAAQ